MLKLLVRCFPKIICPEDKGRDASKENPGESIKPRILLKPNCSHAWPQEEVFLSTLVCVCTCRCMYTGFLTETVSPLILVDLMG